MRILCEFVYSGICVFFKCVFVKFYLKSTKLRCIISFCTVRNSWKPSWLCRVIRMVYEHIKVLESDSCKPLRVHLPTECFLEPIPGENIKYHYEAEPHLRAPLSGPQRLRPFPACYDLLKLVSTPHGAIKSSSQFKWGLISPHVGLSWKLGSQQCHCASSVH